MNNPWLDLPQKAPFIALCDLEILDDQEYKLDGLRFDAFPEPYGGNIDTASVFCLLLNPGFEEADITANFANPYWVHEVRANIEHKSEFPFLYLSPELRGTGGYKWWTTKLGPLLKADVTTGQLARGIMMVQFMPYHSVTYVHNRLYLPTQLYQFQIVRNAMKLHKTIIIMRAKNKWFEAIPELINYPYLELSNPRNVSISRANLDNKNGIGTFDKVVAILKEKPQ